MSIPQKNVISKANNPFTIQPLVCKMDISTFAPPEPQKTARGSYLGPLDTVLQSPHSFAKPPGFCEKWRSLDHRVWKNWEVTGKTVHGQASSHHVDSLAKLVCPRMRWRRHKVVDHQNGTTLFVACGSILVINELSAEKCNFLGNQPFHHTTTSI